MIQGINFDNQSPTAKDHGVLFSGMLSDGILFGCEISYAGENATVGAGYYIAKGRQCRITAAETKTLTGTSGYARLKAIVDLSGVASETSFSQASIAVDYASSLDGFPALTQEDVNAAGTLYEIELAVLTLGAGGVTAVYRKCAEAHNQTLFIPKEQILSDVSAIPADAPDYKLFFVTV